MRIIKVEDYFVGTGMLILIKLMVNIIQDYYVAQAHLYVISSQA